MLEKVRVLVQGFIRTLESPLQQIIYLRDIVEISQKKDRLLQVFPVRIADDQREVFHRRIRDRLLLYYPADHIHLTSVAQGGVVYYILGTGEAVRHSFERLHKAVQELDNPLEHLEDPQEISRLGICDMESE